MSKTIITTKSYHEVKRHGKTVDKKMLDATFDGKHAVIDRFDNNRAYRYELSPEDIQDIIKKMSHVNTNSVVEPSVVSSRRTPKSTRRSPGKTRGRGRGRGRSRGRSRGRGRAKK
jgi:hypothetical protein